LLLHWLDKMKAAYSEEQNRLTELLSVYRDTDSVIWYLSTGFNITPFFLEPFFNIPSTYSNYSHEEHYSPIIDNGTETFPQGVYKITGKEPLLYVFTDLNVLLFHETNEFGRMYKTFKNNGSIKLKGNAAYNGQSWQQDYFAWMLTDMIPFRFWGDEFSFHNITAGHNLSGTRESFDDYFKNGWVPDWHGFYIQIRQQGRFRGSYLNHTYTVLCFCIDNSGFITGFLLPYKLRAK